MVGQTALNVRLGCGPCLLIGSPYGPRFSDALAAHGDGKEADASSSTRTTLENAVTAPRTTAYGDAPSTPA